MPKAKLQTSNFKRNPNFKPQTSKEIPTSNFKLQKKSQLQTSNFKRNPNFKLQTSKEIPTSNIKPLKKSQLLP